MPDHDADARRIPLRGGDEYDALTRGKGVYRWRAGDRGAIKAAYARRFRRLVRLALRGRTSDA